MDGYKGEQNKYGLTGLGDMDKGRVGIKKEDYGKQVIKVTRNTRSKR